MCSYEWELHRVQLLRECLPQAAFPHFLSFLCHLGPQFFLAATHGMSPRILTLLFSHPLLYVTTVSLSWPEGAQSQVGSSHVVFSSLSQTSPGIHLSVMCNAQQKPQSIGQIAPPPTGPTSWTGSSPQQRPQAASEEARLMAQGSRETL